MTLFPFMDPKRPGRNDTCPCGSGRKFKHCCLGKQEPTATDLAGQLIDAARGAATTAEARGLFVTALLNIQVAEVLSDDDVKLGLMDIINKDLIRERCAPVFIEQVGTLESNAIRSAQAVAWSEVPFSGNVDLADGNMRLYQMLGYLKHYLHALWLIRDNAVCFETGFLRIANPNGATFITGNHISSTCISSAGERSAVSFSRQELQQAASILRNSIHPLIQGKSAALNSLGADLLQPQLLAKAELSRPLRAWGLLDEARATNDLGIRIVWYCTILECLFSTDTQDLAHKVAQRVALFLRDTLSERKAVFQIVKQAYSVRSATVHGDTLGSKKERGIMPLSREIDGIVREVLCRILTNPEHLKVFQSDKSQLDEFFLDSSLSVGLATPAQRPGLASN